MTGPMQDYTVVIPAHDAAPFLAATVESVRAQTAGPHEIIVVDDASTDGTGDIARALGVTVVSHRTSRFAAGARNAGIAAASTPLVAFIDADDLWTPDHAESLLVLMDDPATVFAFSGSTTFGGSTHTFLPDAADGVHGAFFDRLFVGNPVVQSGTMVRRECLDAIGGYDESLRVSEDYEIWFRLAELGAVGVSRKASVLRRLHAAQLSTSTTFISSSWRVRARHAARVLAVADGSRNATIAATLDQAVLHDREYAVWTGRPEVLDELRDAVSLFDSEVPGLDLTRHLGGGSRVRRTLLDLRAGARRLARGTR